MSRRILPALLFLSIAALAQRPAAKPVASGPPTFRLLSVKVRGSKLYSDREIIAAAGLKLDESVTQADLQQASNRIGSSGVFSTVSYQFAGAPGGVNVTFDVRDNPQLVPVVFQNLVWFSRDELLSALRERLPLFHDQIPLAGEMEERVRAALDQILAEHNIKAKVASLQQGAIGKVPTAMGYYLDGVDVRIAAIDFTGRAAVEQNLLDTALVDRKKEAFMQPVSAISCAGMIRTVYLARGYLAIKVGEPQVQLVDPDPASPAVKLTFPLEEGRQYALSGIGWQGNTAFSASELQASLEVKEQELNNTRKLYGRRGYLNVAFTPAPELHDDATANIIIAVNEGAQYRMGELSFKGLPPDLEQKARAIWKIPPGAIYDQTYPDRFLNDAISALWSVNSPRFGFLTTEKMDDQLHTVDVIIEYKRR